MSLCDAVFDLTSEASAVTRTQGAAHPTLKKRNQEFKHSVDFAHFPHWLFKQNLVLFTVCVKGHCQI